MSKGSEREWKRRKDGRGKYGLMRKGKRGEARKDEKDEGRAREMNDKSLEGRRKRKRVGRETEGGKERGNM